MSQEDAGKRVCTTQFPSGVSTKTVYNRINTNSAYIESVVRFVRSLRTENEKEAEFLDKKTVNAALEQLLGGAVDTLRKAILDGDVKAAIEVLDRNLGKATQVHKHGGDVNVNHIVWNPQPVRLLAAQEVDMLNSSRLLEALPADVLEAELVESN